MFLLGRNNPVVQKTHHFGNMWLVMRHIWCRFENQIRYVLVVHSNNDSIEPFFVIMNQQHISFLIKVDCWIPEYPKWFAPMESFLPLCSTETGLESILTIAASFLWHNVSSDYLVRDDWCVCIVPLNPSFHLTPSYAASCSFEDISNLLLNIYHRLHPLRTLLGSNVGWLEEGSCWFETQQRKRSWVHGRCLRCRPVMDTNRKEGGWLGVQNIFQEFLLLGYRTKYDWHNIFQTYKQNTQLLKTKHKEQFIKCGCHIEKRTCGISWQFCGMVGTPKSTCVVSMIRCNRHVRFGTCLLMRTFPTTTTS